MFKFEKNETTDSTVITFEGTLDENATLPPLDSITNNTLTVDLGKLITITSIGIRAWIKWLEDSSKNTPITLILRKCPSVFVNQMNIFQNFLLPSTIVESVLVPFYCDECDINIDQVFSLKSLKDNTVSVGKSDIATPTADQCENPTGCQIEPDIFPQIYFKFLNRVKTK